MSKLKLNLDALRVDSFDTDAAAGARGTVRGAESVSLLPVTDDGSNSDGETCRSCVTCNAPTDPCICDRTLGC